MIRKIFCVLIFLPFMLNAQKALEINEFYEMVGQTHPVANRALLIVSRGEAAVSQMRGAFDPKLVSSYSNKQFEDKSYYDIWDTYLKVPTLLNVDLKAGFERNSGLFLNPEQSVPTNGLYYAGLTVPIGQGLFVNQRNIDLKKGKLTQLELEIEAEMILNNLFLDATYTFWHWYGTTKKLELVRSNVELINERFEGTRQGVLNGENAAIDSIEMLIQVQQWSNTFQKADLDYKNSLLLLNNFIWDDDVNLTNVIPEDSLRNSLSELGFYLDFGSSNHPILRNLTVQNSKLDLDKKLYREQIKPIVDLNYNVLLSENNPAENTAFLSNNYKAGINFSFPLLVRKERAKLRTASLKREENNLKLNQKRREISNKIEQTFNKILRLQDMISRQQMMIENYQRMLDGEISKFNNGESSIFLINSRENKKLNSEMKLIDLKVEYGRVIGLLQWSSGILANELNR